MRSYKGGACLSPLSRSLFPAGCEVKLLMRLCKSAACKDLTSLQLKFIPSC